MTLVDTHCHLYAQDFDTDIDIVIQRAKAAGVSYILLPAIDTANDERLFQLSLRSNSECQLLPMAGLHPCSVNADWEKSLQIVQQQLNSGVKYYAVGETGLDYHWDLTYKEQQISAFDQQIKWSVEYKLPIVIHSRKSTYDCIKYLKPYAVDAKGVFHCFSGSLEEALQIIDLGFYLGIGGVVTYKNSGLKDVLQQIGLERIVLETDAPYLPPVPHRGKRNEPAYVSIVAMTIAQMLGKSVEEVASQTTENAKQLFGLNN